MRVPNPPAGPRKAFGEATRMSMRATAIWLFLSCAACHSSDLAVIAGDLQFSLPSNPTALTEPDAGLVVIDFGQVTVDSTNTLTVDLSSLVGQVTLGST